jgi:hypothetical protein
MQTPAESQKEFRLAAEDGRGDINIGIKDSFIHPLPHE